jgi:hypothetical protein
MESASRIRYESDALSVARGDRLAVHGVAAARPA